MNNFKHRLYVWKFGFHCRVKIIFAGEIKKKVNSSHLVPYKKNWLVTIFDIFFQVISNDDAFITGQLREAIGIQPLYLNPRYTYEEPSILKWLDNSNGLPLPYLFAKVKSTKDKWSTVMRRLWKQTLLVHGQQDW